GPQAVGRGSAVAAEVVDEPALRPRGDLGEIRPDQEFPVRKGPAIMHAAERGIDAFADEARAGEGIAEDVWQREREMRLIAEFRDHFDPAVLGAYDAGTAGQHIERLVPGELLGDERQRARFQPVIRGEQRNHVAARALYAFVDRLGGPAIRAAAHV